jgi:hypothetical protein
MSPSAVFAGIGMRVLKLLAIIGATGFAVHLWQGHTHRPVNFGIAAAEPSPNGFVATAMPEGAQANTVLILAPVNCPSKAAQRADALSRKLTEMSIPNKRGNSFSLKINNPTREQQAGMKRAGNVLGGEIPAVFINGMGKSNPSAEEVAAEYERTAAKN